MRSRRRTASSANPSGTRDPSSDTICSRCELVDRTRLRHSDLVGRAAERGRTDAVRLLVDLGFDIDACPRITACTRRRCGVISPSWSSSSSSAPTRPSRTPRTTRHREDGPRTTGTPRWSTTSIASPDRPEALRPPRVGPGPLLVVSDRRRRPSEPIGVAMACPLRGGRIDAAPMRPPRSTGCLRARRSLPELSRSGQRRRHMRARRAQTRSVGRPRRVWRSRRR